MGELDAQLNTLVDPLQRVLHERSCCLLMLAWKRIPHLPLIPFHLQLRWPGRLEELSLNPRIALIPFFESDNSIVSTPTYRVGDVIAARKAARAQRGTLALTSDFVLQDWESKVEKRLERFQTLVLPGSSFVAVDQVNPDDVIVPGHRSVIGRIAARTGLRPSVLVASKRGVTAKSIKTIEQQDLIVVNAQGLRGWRTITSIQTLLRFCRDKTPILIVVSSPSDAFQFASHAIERGAKLQFEGKLPSEVRLSVSSVGADRPSVEREFEFCVADLDDRAPGLRNVLRLAKSAWWAVRQATHRDNTELKEIRRFAVALDRASVEKPVEAGLFNAVRELLTREAKNVQQRSTRARALLDATIAMPGKGPTLVVVRDDSEVNELRSRIAVELGIDIDSLEELGVYVTSIYGYWPDRAFDGVIAAGYFGTATLDIILGCRAPAVRFVVDPIEARIAWYHLQHIAELLKLAGASGPLEIIESIAKELSGYIATFGSLVELSLAPSVFRGGDETMGRAVPTSASEVIVAFIDGSSIEVNRHTRFDVMRLAGKKLKNLQAIELEPGDQVVVLREDSRILFSEKLLAALDKGPLAALAGKRATWLGIVSAICAEKHQSPQAILRLMEEKGQSVDLATIRSWLRRDSIDDPSIPDRLDCFMAFSSVLGIALPKETLFDLYGGIQGLRVNHRKFGRELARAVRAAHLGRLDAPTLRKIERDWGLDTRQLVEGARVAVVDEVILPEGAEDAAQ